MAALGAYSLPAHSVYELAALTQDLDTQAMTTKIKEVLLANNIGQKIFGEAVLGLSQGSVSELLSKPKPWHMLSIKGREPFIRMQLWLSDPRNIEHIQRLKTERREAGKRRRDVHFPIGVADVAPNSNASSNTNSFLGGDNSSNDGSVGGSPSPCANTQSVTGAPSSSPSPAKKQRILFSEHQKEALKLAFSLDPYPSTSAMEFLAQELNLSTRTITNWFHNHRMRLKQQQTSDKEEISSNGGRESSGQFDPIHFRLLFHQRLFEMQAASGDDHSGHHGATPAGLPASLAGLPPQIAGNLNMMAQLGMPYPFYATGMLSQFCMGLGNPSPDMAPGSEGLDLTLARQRAAMNQSDSDGGDDSECDSDASAEDRRSRSAKGTSPITVAAKTSHQDEPSAQARSSRRSRKPAAPQWVNPHWQQSPAARDRQETEDADEGDKKKIKLVDANLNNFVESDVVAARESPAPEEDDLDDEEDDVKGTRRAPSTRSPSPTSEDEKMDDDEAKDDDNE